MADVAQCVARCLAESDAIPPRPPSSYIMNELLSAARQVLAENPALHNWMLTVGLDPDGDQDALFAIGVAVASRVEEGDPA